MAALKEEMGQEEEERLRQRAGVRSWKHGPGGAGPGPGFDKKAGKVHIIITGWRYKFDREPIQGKTDLRPMALDAFKRCQLTRDMPWQCINVCGDKHDQVRKEDQHRGCTGFREEVQVQVARQESLREKLASDLGAWLCSFDPANRGLRCTFGPDDDWALVLYCKSGRHRSVACACLAQACLEFLGWDVNLHLRATDLSPTCRGNCKHCRGPPLKSKEALDLLWTSLRGQLPMALLPKPLRRVVEDAWADLAPGRGPISQESKRPRR